MSSLIREARTLYGVGLWFALFPFVFLATFAENLPRHWRHGILNTIGGVVLAGICFWCVDVIRLAR